MIKVLGLDLSLTGTGIAIINDGTAGERWLVKTNGNSPDLERFDYIAHQIMERLYGDELDRAMTGMRRIDLVAMEGVYASRNLETFGRLTALSTVVQYALWRSKVPFLVLPPAAWRKALFGPKSKVDKERVRVATFEQLTEHLGDLDVVKVDLNVLEAFLVGLAAWKMETGAVPRPVERKPRRLHRAVTEEGMAEARFAQR